jgi:ABC-type thiamin/hydroxymethylpyrimidine transport system permease subunit
VYVTDSGGVVNGGDDTSPTQTFTITVTPVNDQPTTGGIANLTVNEDAAPSVIDLFAAFADVEDADAALTYTVTGNTNPGLYSAITVNAVAGTLTLNYLADVNGSSDITVRANDTAGQFVETTFTVTVTAVTDAVADTITTNEDTAQTIDVLANDSFDPGAVVSGVTQGANGTVTFLPGGNVTYTSNPDFNGADSFTYTVSSGGVSETATVNVTVNAVADVVDDNVTTPEDTPVTFNVVANDLFSGPWTLTSVIGAVNGSIAFLANGDVTYTPNADFNGIETLSYTVTEDDGTAETATINLTVTAAADAVADAISTNEDTAQTIDVLANDAFGLGAVVSGVTQGASGTVTFLPGGDVTYTPNADFNGADSFTYTVTSGAVNETATVNVVVDPVNDMPVLTIGANQTINEDAGAQSVPAFANAVPGGGPDETSQTFSYSVSTDNAALFSVQPTIDAGGNLTYVAAANANGAANVSIVLSDNGGTANGGVDSAPAQLFTITVNPVNDAPVLGANSLAIDQGASVTFGSANLSAADIDSPLASLVYTVSGVANGRFELSSAPGVAISSFTQAELDAGQVVFVHNGSGTAPAYSVQVSDGALSDGPVAAGVSFGAIVISDESSPPKPSQEPPPQIEPLEPAAAAPQTPTEDPEVVPPPVFSPGRPEPEANELVETITQLKRAEARQLLVKVVQPVLSNNDYEPEPAADVVMQLLDVTPAQLEYRASAPLDWEVAPAFAEGFQDEAEQQLQVLLDSVKFGGMALSVGVVWWASRISAMIGSLVASAPAWKHIDPLPVLGQDEEEKDKWLEPDDREADANELAVALVLEGGQVAGASTQAE